MGAMSAPALALLLFGPAPEFDAPDRLLAVAPGLYSGAEPHGEGHFAALARLGVKTVLSVDGPVPDAAAARRHGLRTVHVPIGYDGVPADAAARLSAVMARFGPAGAAPGGVFVHCHHGKHRGPAGAAVCGLSAGLLDRTAALALLDAAGTSPRYAGLWESVASFAPPATPFAEALPEAVEPDGLAAAMIAVAALRESAGAAGSSEESGTPAGTLLAESLRESARLPDLSEPVRAELRRSADLADRGAWAALDRHCAECHAAHRD